MAGLKQETLNKLFQIFDKQVLQKGEATIRATSRSDGDVLEWDIKSPNGGENGKEIIFPQQTFQSNLD